VLRPPNGLRGSASENTPAQSSGSHARRETKRSSHCGKTWVLAANNRGTKRDGQPPDGLAVDRRYDVNDAGSHDRLRVGMMLPSVWLSRRLYVVFDLTKHCFGIGSGALKQKVSWCGADGLCLPAPANLGYGRFVLTKRFAVAGKSATAAASDSEHQPLFRRRRSMSLSQLSADHPSAHGMKAAKAQLTPFRYLIPVVTVAAATAFTSLLEVGSSGNPYLFLFFISIVVSAWFAGPGPGWLSVFLTIFAVDFLSYRQILVTAVPVRRRRLWADGQPVWR